MMTPLLFVPRCPKDNAATRQSEDEFYARFGTPEVVRSHRIVSALVRVGAGASQWLRRRRRPARPMDEGAAPHTTAL